MDDNMLDSDLLLSQSSAGQEEDKARATLVDQQSASAIATSLENKSILANDSPAVALNDSSAVACLVNAGVMIGENPISRCNNLSAADTNSFDLITDIDKNPSISKTYAMIQARIRYQFTLFSVNHHENIKLI